MHKAVAPAESDVPPELDEPPNDEPPLPLLLPDELEPDVCVVADAGLAVLVTVTVGAGAADFVTVTAGAGAADFVAVAVMVTVGLGAGLAALELPPPTAAPTASSTKPPAHTRLRLCRGRMSGMRTGSGGWTAHGPGWYWLTRRSPL
ncbi:hypothetical protein [Streptomyces sp. Li-HN-5-11]|uniref:hypothetical protein n=1 Tax=Streptomyces sp. Li-HN-5-11 TaxID=3075432 RepID=UPI0037DA4BD0